MVRERLSSQFEASFAYHIYPLKNVRTVFKDNISFRLFVVVVARTGFVTAQRRKDQPLVTTQEKAEADAAPYVWSNRRIHRS